MSHHQSAHYLRSPRAFLRHAVWVGLSLGGLGGCAQLIGADFDAKTTSPEYFAGGPSVLNGSGGAKPSGGTSGDGRASGGRGSGGKASGGTGAAGETSGGTSSGGTGGAGTGGAGTGGSATGGEAGSAGLCAEPGDCPADAVVINEISAQGRPDFIELYNAGDTPADLSGYGVTDGDVTPDIGHLLIVPEGTVLEAGKFLYLQEDARPTVTCVIGEDRCLWFAFGISKSGDTVYLLTPGNEVQDSLSYPADGASLGLGDNDTWGRYPDGADATERLIPTEKAPNVSADAP